MATLHVFEFLQQAAKYQKSAVVILFGDEAFLRQLARQAYAEAATGGDLDFALTQRDGGSIAWAEVRDMLGTASLFGPAGRQILVIEEADEFVKRHRAQLEDYVAAPSSRGSLVLQVDSWPANTRLYKAIDRAKEELIQIACAPPMKKGGRSRDHAKINQWMIQRAAQAHHIQLSGPAATELQELVAGNFGRAEQEMAKLSLLLPPEHTISPADIREHVGGWRIRSVWEMIDAALDGRSDEALTILNRILLAGDHPLAVLGPMSWALRRYSRAALELRREKLLGRRANLDEILVQAGFRTWGDELNLARSRLRRIGGRRAIALQRLLLDVDTALKGSHSDDRRGRFALEQLVTRISR